MNCVRCHKDKDLTFNGICNECAVLILKEWKIKQEEVYEDLQAA